MKKQIVQLLDAVSQLERKRHESQSERARMSQDFDAARGFFEATLTDYENGACDGMQLRCALDKWLSTSRASSANHTRFLQETTVFLSRMPFDISYIYQEETALSPKTTPWNLREPFDA